MGGSPRVWLIAGPTASGKSALAMALAQASGGEIVNADALQLYRDLRVLTARPSVDDEAQVPHRLYGAADGAESWSVGRWLRAVEPLFHGRAHDAPPLILVGGTGLYFSALTRGLADVPDIATSVRDALQAQVDAGGEAAFRARLSLRDPRAAATIATGDRQRLVRAMAVVEATGEPLSQWWSRTRPTLAPDRWRGMVLAPPRAALYARCDARLDAMIARGALAEAAALLRRGLEPTAPIMKAVGLRELARHLSGELGLADARALASRETRRFAKRQTTWFRNQAADWPRSESEDPSTVRREGLAHFGLG